MEEAIMEQPEERETAPLRTSLLITIAAAALFFVLFRDSGIAGFDFWWSMAGLNLLLFALSLAGDLNYGRRLAADFSGGILYKSVLGLISALVLYLVFALGQIVSEAFIPGARDNIQNVYLLKEAASLPRIVLLIALIIGPGEELFWRGFLQHRLTRRLGAAWGLAAAALLYAGVHIASGNLMLVLAALVCGVFWGFTYWRFQSVLLNAISHTAWDLAVFIFFPFT